jgi:hypothetical protein
MSQATSDLMIAEIGHHSFSSLFRPTSVYKQRHGTYVALKSYLPGYF